MSLWIQIIGFDSNNTAVWCSVALPRHLVKWVEKSCMHFFLSRREQFPWRRIHTLCNSEQSWDTKIGCGNAALQTQISKWLKTCCHVFSIILDEETKGSTLMVLTDERSGTFYKREVKSSHPVTFLIKPCEVHQLLLLLTESPGIRTC